MAEPKQITALILLEKAADFLALAARDWTIESIESHPPTMIRFRQLRVLLKLYIPEVGNGDDTHAGLKSLLEGDFILERDATAYGSLVEMMNRELISAGVDLRNGRGRWTRQLLKDHFDSLLYLKTIVNRLNNFGSGVLEASGEYRYPIVMAKKIAAQVNTESLDAFLSLTIDPLGRTFTKEELVAEHNYPPEDLDEVDGDWI
jgi:hypothetical protein